MESFFNKNLDLIKEMKNITPKINTIKGAKATKVKFIFKNYI